MSKNKHIQQNKNRLMQTLNIEIMGHGLLNNYADYV